MSSLAAVQADGFYYPPEYHPKHGSLNKFRGSHALRERAKKIHEGILIIRFEMPYNIFCEGCGNHIAMGVRFNAEKKRVDWYFSTPIIEFSMKCHMCDQKIVMRSDPKNVDYIVVSGARKKTETYDATSAESIELKDKATADRLNKSALYRVEYAEMDKRNADEAADRMEQLYKLKTTETDDGMLSNKLRTAMRHNRRKIALQHKLDAQKGIQRQLAPLNDSDRIAASHVNFRLHSEEFVEQQRQTNLAKRRKTISSQLLLPGHQSRPNYSTSILPAAVDKKQQTAHSKPRNCIIRRRKCNGVEGGKSYKSDARISSPKQHANMPDLHTQLSHNQKNSPVEPLENASDDEQTLNTADRQCNDVCKSIPLNSSASHQDLNSPNQAFTGILVAYSSSDDDSINDCNDDEEERA